jgi:hypothetical protein
VLPLSRLIFRDFAQHVADRASEAEGDRHQAITSANWRSFASGVATRSTSRSLG